MNLPHAVSRSGLLLLLALTASACGTLSIPSFGPTKPARRSTSSEVYPETRKLSVLAARVTAVKSTWAVRALAGTQIMSRNLPARTADTGLGTYRHECDQPDQAFLYQIIERTTRRLLPNWRPRVPCCRVTCSGNLKIT
ncbi:MAG: hypothetical protein M1283_05870 [Gammaproteobacteria bacterium]|nr:hypothetical protein [Gammaproteobacteria bacterium]